MPKLKRYKDYKMAVLIRDKTMGEKPWEQTVALIVNEDGEYTGERYLFRADNHSRIAGNSFDGNGLCLYDVKVWGIETEMRGDTEVTKARVHVAGLHYNEPEVTITGRSIQGIDLYRKNEGWTVADKHRICYGHRGGHCLAIDEIRKHGQTWFLIYGYDGKVKKEIPSRSVYGVAL